jgi:hypothetical protein
MGLEVVSDQTELHDELEQGFEFVRGTVACAPRIWSREETSTPLGWLPLIGCSSCGGSPNRASRGLRDGENVRERHLGGSVDEENVDDFRRVGSGTEPGGRTSDHAVRVQSIEKRSVVRREAQSREIVLLFGNLPHHLTAVWRLLPLDER